MRSIAASDSPRAVCRCRSSFRTASTGGSRSSNERIENLRRALPQILCLLQRTRSARSLCAAQASSHTLAEKLHSAQRIQ